MILRTIAHNIKRENDERKQFLLRLIRIAENDKSIQTYYQGQLDAIVYFERVLDRHLMGG
jgi:hypothetical protein